MKPIPFYRQFVLGPISTRVAEDWRSIALSHGMHLSWDPDLPFTDAQRADRRLMLLGDALDPLHPERSNAEIAQHVLADCVSFDKMREATLPLGGRYAAILQIDASLRVYTDAFASRAVFYMQDDDGICWASGSPGLLAKLFNLARDDHRMERLFSQPYGTQMPGAVTPFARIRLLWCHHTLNPLTGNVERYYPHTPLSSRSVDDAAVSIHRHMEGLFASALQRRPVVVGLSGGFDSRIMLAAVKAFVDKVEFVTWTAPGIPKNDVKLACGLARRLGLNHRLVEVLPPDPELEKAVDLNCAGAVWGGARSNLTSLVKTYGDARYIVSGNGGETGRCYLYKEGRHPVKLEDARDLCAQTEFQDNSVAMEAYAEWRATLHHTNTIPLLDLCHWELHSGVWLGWTYLTQEWGGHPFMAFNSRGIIEAMLSVNPELRAYPHVLCQRVVELFWPRALGERINLLPPRSWGTIQLWRDRVRRTLSVMAESFGRS